MNENAVKKPLTDRLRSSFTNLSISARAIAGSNPPEGCPFRTLYRVSSLARNLTRVWFQSPFFNSAFLADLTGSYLRPSLAGRLVRRGPDEDATGAGSGSGGVTSYEIL